MILFEAAEANYVFETGQISRQAIGLPDTDTVVFGGAVASFFRRERSSLYNRALNVTTVEQAKGVVDWFRHYNIPCRIDLAFSDFPTLPMLDHRGEGELVRHFLAEQGFSNEPLPYYTNAVIGSEIPSVEQAGRFEAADWRDVVAIQRAVWSELETWGDEVSEYYRLLSGHPQCTCFIGRDDGIAVSTGSVWVFGEVAYLFGGAVMESARKGGWHRALLQERLHFAQSQGCRYATALVHPGSQSERNCLAMGLSVAYHREVWIEKNWMDHPFYSGVDGEAGLDL